MQKDNALYTVETGKSVTRFVEDFIAAAEKNDFIINNKATMDMRETFTRHGGTVPETFDLHMLQICKPAKAGKSLTTNPERAILMPKFVHVFSGREKTQVRFLGHSPEQITALVRNDQEFPASLAQTYDKIRSLIDQAA